ncbi:MAG TPA: winged helix-turn-helix domain-containing protein [Mycobacterium sp.]
MSKKAWRLFCSHGTVLFYIAQQPDCTISEIADALTVTPRTVWGLIGDLKRAGLVDSRREGKRHYYTINGAGRFPDPLLSHLTLDEALKAIMLGSDQVDPPGRAAAGRPARPANENVKALLEGAPLV